MRLYYQAQTKTGQPQIIGMLSNRRYTSTVAAQEQEGKLYTLAARLLGRDPDEKEVRRRFADVHPATPRRERPAEVRYLGIHVTQTDGPLSEADRHRIEIARLERKAEAEGMSPKERFYADQLRQSRAALAKLTADDMAAAELATLKASKGWQARRDAADVLRIIAAFDPTAPDYELEAYDEAERLLNAGDLSGFDRYAEGIRERALARQAEQSASALARIAPTMSAANALTTALDNLDDLPAETDEPVVSDTERTGLDIRSILDLPFDNHDPNPVV